MSDCIPELLPDRRWHCAVCGFTSLRPVAPEIGIERISRPCIIVAAKTPPRGRCRHRGEKLREEKCGTCPGNSRIFVFGCALLGECTVAKKLTGIECCASGYCERWEAAGLAVE